MTSNARAEILLTFLILGVAAIAGFVGYGIGKSLRDWKFIQIKTPVSASSVDCYVRAHKEAKGQ